MKYFSTALLILAFHATSAQWLGTNPVYFNAGNVGIGTSTPAAKLDVRGYLLFETGGSPFLYTGTGSTELNRYLKLFNSPNATSASGLMAGGILVADSYTYATPGKNDLVVKGLVGIGTGAPGFPLEVSTSQTSTSITSSNNYPLSLVNRDQTTLSIAGIQFKDADGVAPSAGVVGMRFTSHGSDFGNFFVVTRGSDGFLERLTITDAGDVGIATATPATKLDVLGQIRANTHFHLGSDGFSSSDRGITVNNGASTSWNLMDLSNNNGSWFKVLGDGKVGIGTNSPSSKLHISTTGSSAMKIQRTGSSVFGYEILATSFGLYDYTDQTYRWRVNTGDLYLLENGGNVGIGTIAPDAKLAVKGQVHAQEVKVDLLGAVAPDYVFNKDYKLPSLEEIKSYIEKNNHLPEVPSAKEMEANGMNLGEMNLLLLKKVEELTLYMIELKEDNLTLREEIRVIKENKK